MGAPQIHDRYGKRVLKGALGDDFDSSPKLFSFGEGAGRAKIDGEIDESIAVEIESRGGKQVRGALVDLTLHPHRKLLLVIIKKHGNRFLEAQCKSVLERLTHGKPYEIVVLEGTGSSGDSLFLDDVARVRFAVEKLRNKD